MPTVGIKRDLLFESLGKTYSKFLHYFNLRRISRKAQVEYFWQMACLAPSQPAITCSKLTIEVLEKGMKYVQS